MDADEHKGLGGRYEVRGFPTIKWFPNGVSSPPEDYSGGRDLESLSEFVTKKSGKCKHLLKKKQRGGKEGAK